MAYLDTIFPIIDNIDGAKDESLEILEYVGADSSVVYDSSTDRLFEIITKLLYCKALDGFTGIHFPVNLSNIGYSYPYNLVANAQLYEQYYQMYINIDIVASQILTNRNDVRTLYTNYNDSSTNVSSYCSGKDDMYISPKFNTINVTNISKFFKNSKNLIVVPELNTSSCTNMSEMFSGCESIYELPPMTTTGHATNMSYMFYGCSKLKMLPYLDASSATNMVHAFDDCTNLEMCMIYGLKTDLDLSYSNNVIKDSLMFIINNMQTVQSKTLTLGEANYNKLSSAERAIATEKGWIVTA